MKSKGRRVKFSFILYQCMPATHPNLQDWSQLCCLTPNKINSNGIHANVKLMPSLSIWLFPHPILFSLTPSIAPLPDPLSILCDSWRGNLTWASPSHPIIVTHSCSSAGTQSWRAVDRFHCCTVSPSMCLRADIPAHRDSSDYHIVKTVCTCCCSGQRQEELQVSWLAVCLQPAEDRGWPMHHKNSGCKGQAAAAAGHGGVLV